MFDGDDSDEAEDGNVIAKSREDKNTSTRESRKEREARLKQMMEDDDGRVHSSPVSIIAILTHV
jgi:DNA polymerase delta subunit 3